MASRKTIFQKNEYYHIYNRGANSIKIFRSEENYYYLLRLIKKYFNNFNISIIAYCLMPNHYHFLLRQDSDLSISQFIQALFNSYTKAFNKMYGRSGTLFEGAFKSIHIYSQEYLTYLCRYIHRNPIEADTPLVNKLQDWKFSNYPEWLNLRNGTLVDKKFIKDMFEDNQSYRKFVEEYTPPPKLQEKLGKYLLE